MEKQNLKAQNCHTQKGQCVLDLEEQANLHSNNYLKSVQENITSGFW